MSAVDAIQDIEVPMSLKQRTTALTIANSAVFAAAGVIIPVRPPPKRDASGLK
ncbi:hypothetical protein [Burkholderia cepacia]|uniref:hypothetical protein n=1 Tax=Burkholderia cepacia TaxID=292 RepID=UPI001589A936|nr:hypothetical protein [Burkholderia cepacia]